MSTWAGIVRVSHMGDRKADADNFHADSQQVADIERGVPHGDRLDLLPPELDVSGGLPLEKRPTLLAAVEGVEAGKYAGIIVAYLSRLGRNTREQLRAWDRVEAAGGRIICVAENIDTATPSGRFMRTVMLANAEREREEHVERFDNLRRWATEAGIPALPNVPRGYRRDEATRQLVPADDADMIRAAFAARAAGEPVVKIAQRLGMTAQGARYLLSNRVYLGELRSGRYLNANAHPPLIDADTFEAAQRRVARPSRSKVLDGPALLAGLVRCSGCGHVMTRNRSVKAGPMYRCPVHHSGERCPAPTTIGCAALDGYVEAIALAELDKLRVSAASGKSAEDAKAEHEQAKAELAAYIEATSALGDVAAFAEGAASRKAKVDATHDQWQAEAAARHAADPRSLDAHDRNALMRALFAAVIVGRVGRGRKVPVEQRARVLAVGSPLATPQRSGSRGAGIVPLPLPDLDQPGVLRVALGEDELQGAGGRREVVSH